MRIDPSQILYGDFSHATSGPSLSEAIQIKESLNYLQGPTLKALWELETKRKSVPTESHNTSGWSSSQISKVCPLPSGARSAAGILRALRDRGMVRSAETSGGLRHSLSPEKLRVLNLVFE